MSEEIVISLILPCYNVEKYIDECLHSIYSQDISEKTFEVICVNDCSTDTTEELILTFKEKHNNLTLLKHDVNKNLGASRNTGMLKAKGKYVWFIDSDDFITEYCLSNIIFELEKNELDILEINSYLSNMQVNPLFLEANYTTDSVVMSGYNYLRELINTPYWGRKVEVWRRIYRREFLVANRFTFSELLFGVEDMMFFYKTIVLCKRFKHLANYCYVYRNDNSESMTNSNANLGSKLAVRIVATLQVIDFFKNHILTDDAEFRHKAIYTYRWSFKQFSRKIFLLDSKNLNGYFEKLNFFIPEIKTHLSCFEANLISNRLLVKLINVIFVQLNKIRYFFKKLQ